MRALKIPEGTAAKAAVEVLAPSEQTLPCVYSSPHSGTWFPPDFLAAIKLEPLALRRSEDSFVDELFGVAPTLGAPLIRALFARAFCDVNREPYELDPTMFEDELPAYANTTSLRVAGGLGTIARVVGGGTEIYGRKLTFAEAERRIADCYRPYHKMLSELLQDTVERFGCAVLVDCHSMPSVGGPLERDEGRPRPDIVLGDRFGSTCSPLVADKAERTLRLLGYRVVRNRPYAGGFNTQHYGRPADGVHALQIEINRALYMNEERIERNARFATVAEHMAEVVAELGTLEPRTLKPRR